MIILSITEFAAKRRGDQDDLEKDLFPDVHQAIEAYPVEGWYNDLLKEVARLYLSVFHNEGGQGQPSPARHFSRTRRSRLVGRPAPRSRAATGAATVGGSAGVRSR